MIIIKTKEEIDGIRLSCHILAQIMAKLALEVRSGVTTGYLEDLANQMIAEAGGKPAFKGYKSGKGSKPYPSALCASINDQVVHAPASDDRALKNGDIIGLDLGVNYQGYFSDMAVTLPVGEVSAEAKKLMEVTKKSLELAIAQIKPGNTLNDLARVIQAYVEVNNFSVVRELVGHGVGKAVHEDPMIFNFVTPDGDKTILKPGMVLAIEPMVNVGGWQIEDEDGGLGIVTADGSLSAHFEHTVAVTEDGCEILTKIPITKHQFPNNNQ